MLLLQHLLETSLQQQQVTQELVKGLQVATQELLQQQSRASPLLVHLLDLRHALHLLHKLTPADNTEAYLYTLEQMAFWQDWSEEEWAQSLAPLLTGKAQWAYSSLPPALTEDYLLLKEWILGCCRFSICKATTEFHCWVYQAEVNPHSQTDALPRTTK